MQRKKKEENKINKNECRLYIDIGSEFFFLFIEFISYICKSCKYCCKFKILNAYKVA